MGLNKVPALGAFPGVKGSGAGKLKSYRAPAVKRAQDTYENMQVLGLREARLGMPQAGPEDFESANNAYAYSRGYAEGKAAPSTEFARKVEPIFYGPVRRRVTKPAKSYI